MSNPSYSHMAKFFFIILLLFFIVTNSIKGQTDTEFWFVVPEITIDHQPPGGVPASFRFSSGILPATVTISMPANSNVFPDIVFNLAPNDFEIIDLSCWIVTPCNPPFTPATGYSDINIIENKPYNPSGINNIGIQITSTEPITVYYEVSRASNKDIWSLKGRNGLGTEFFTPFQTHGNNWSAGTVKAYSAIDVVATEDNTSVTFTLPTGIAASYGSAMAVIPAGSTHSITLSKGQTFSLFPQYKVDRISQAADDRLRGVRINSDRPIAVNVKDDSYYHSTGGCYDISGDQLIPTNLIGKEYVVIRSELTNFDHIYMLATENATTITVFNSIGEVVSSKIINEQNQWYIQLPTGQEFYKIIADKPIYVWHVGGFGCEQGGAILPPIDMCTGSPRLAFARTNNETFYINLMVRNGAEASFLFDGLVREDLFPSTNYTPLPLPSEWSIARFGPFTTAQIAVGTHYIENTQDLFHLSIINGNPTSGCFYGYFSNFYSFNPQAFVVLDDELSSLGRLCYGDSAQLIALGGTSYQWEPSTYLDNPNIATPLASKVETSITYNVTISGACGQSESQSVSLLVGSSVIADFLANSINGCAVAPSKGESPEFTFSFANESTGDYFRKWYWKLGENGTQILFANGDDGGGDPANEVELTLVNDTEQILEYYITLVVSDQEQNCFQSMTQVVELYPSTSISPLALPLEGCSPLEVFFSANPTGHIAHVSYQWIFNDGNTSNSENPQHIFLNNTGSITTYDVSLIATNLWGCKDSSQIGITLFPQVIADFILNIEEGTSPLNVNIENTSVAADSFYFNMGDGTEYTDANPTHTFYNYSNVPVEYTISLIATSQNGCTDSSLRTITVNPTPQYQLTIEVNPLESGETSQGGYFNFGQEITLEAFPFNGYEFVGWSINNEVICANSSFIFTMPNEAVTIIANFQLKTYSVSFNIIDVNEAPLNEAVIVLNGVQNEQGNYVFSGILPGTYEYSIFSLCSQLFEGQITVLQSNELVGATMEPFSGDTNGDLLVNLTDVNQVVSHIFDIDLVTCFTNSDIIVDEILNIRDIIATVNIMVNSKRIYYPNISSKSAQLYLSSNGINLVSDGNIQGLQLEIINLQNAINLEMQLQSHQLNYVQNEEKVTLLIYSIDNSPIPAGQINLVSFSNNNEIPSWGNILAANANSELITIEGYGGGTGLNQLLINNIDLKVYPNPARDNLTISFLNNSQNSVNVKLSNLKGQVVLSRAITEVGNVDVTFETNSLKIGIYLLSIDFNGEIVSKLIVIQ